MDTEVEKFCFVVEWYDPRAALVRKYFFSFYPKDNTCEMHEYKTTKQFLRRVKVDNVRLEDLYIGSTLNVLSRQLTFIDYGDQRTREKLNTKTSRTLGLIKPDAVQKMGPILDEIYRQGFLITRLKMCRLSQNEAFDFYLEHQSKPFFNALIGYVTSGPVITFELMGDDAVNRWRSLIGPTDPAVARSQAPMSIRARFGKDQTINSAHGSDSEASAARELEFFFPSVGPCRMTTAKYRGSTCCVIKPHAVNAGIAGKIIEKIQQEGFEIAAMSMFRLEQANAAEFLEVYKGVVQEFPSMVTELTSGSCIAMEVCGPQGDDTPRAFREVVGPADPEIARHLRPRTLRALFGVDKIKNAVHCTDLPEDAGLEVEYFFRILDR